MGRDSCSLCGLKAITLQVCPSVGPLQDAAHSYPGTSEVAGGRGRVTVGRGGLQPDPDTPVGEDLAASRSVWRRRVRFRGFCERPQAVSLQGAWNHTLPPRRQAEALRLSVVSSEATHTSQGPCESQGMGTTGAGARRASRGLAGHGPPGIGPQQQLQHQLQCPRGGLSGPAPLPWQRLGVARAGGGYRPQPCQEAQAEQALATHRGHLDASGRATLKGSPAGPCPMARPAPCGPSGRAVLKGSPARPCPVAPPAPSGLAFAEEPRDENSVVLGSALLQNQQVETHLLAFLPPPWSGEWVSGPWSQSRGPAEARRGGAQPGVCMESRPPPCAPVPKASRRGSWEALPGRLGVQTDGRAPADGGTGRTQTHWAYLPRPRASGPGWWVGAEGLAEPRVSLEQSPPATPMRKSPAPDPEQVGAGAENRETLPTETPTLGSHCAGLGGAGRGPGAVGRRSVPHSRPACRLRCPVRVDTPTPPPSGTRTPERPSRPQCTRNGQKGTACHNTDGAQRFP
ncbi:unnamed protein product [Rangifer tarandus platyrhynchus]|uniref:Uncharacterized protein n=1 Tax=Rangifer tarandus platyrhynchus TaxID=3082113 RepID=A0ABN8ZY58_RANTA|nr:unnamed protein product [Rangifer tarandus platyrhynchus]